MKKNIIKIMNERQVVFYLEKGIEPLRIEKGFRNKLVFIYTKEDTNEVFGEWLEHCKKHKNFKHSTDREN